MQLQTVKITRSALIEATPEIIWAALTTTEGLCAWMCDSAQVELRPGGTFVFKGASIPEGGDAQTLIEYEPVRSALFSWPILDAPTTVRWRLEQQLDMTLVSVTHEAFESPGLVFSDYSPHPAGAQHINLDDLWIYYLGSLKAYIERGESFFKIDLEDPPGAPVVQSFVAPVSPDTAYEAFVDTEKLEQWMTPKAHMDVRVGGKLDFGWGWIGPKEFVALEQGRKVAYSWHKTGEPDSLVEWSIEKEGVNARITLCHSGFGDSPRMKSDNILGWAQILVRLGHYLAKGFTLQQWHTGDSQ